MTAQTAKTGHTPGPWRLDDEIHRFTLIDSNNLSVMYLDPPIDIDDGRSFANARLIAAAPTLLEALREILSTYEMAVDDPEGIQQARAANRLAEGEK